MDPQLQYRNVHRSQNKIEEYHKLRAAINRWKKEIMRSLHTRK
ncbi:hypothetical protein MIDIC_340007 [Alphaproteobacteria bacterium]